MMFLLLLVTQISHAQLKFVKSNQEPNTVGEVKVQSLKLINSSIKKVKSKQIGSNKLAEILQQQNEKLDQVNDLLNKLKKERPPLLVKENHSKIRMLARYKAITIKSVVASNVAPGTMILRINENIDFDGVTELRCKAFPFEKRVRSKCDKMVIDEDEFDVDAEVLDLDGGDGIIADEWYESKEKEFLASSLASFLNGVSSASRSQIMTSIGSMPEQNTKNSVLAGLMGMTSNVSNAIQEDVQKVTIGFLNSKKTVMVLFNQSVKLGQTLSP